MKFEVGDIIKNKYDKDPSEYAVVLSVDLDKGQYDVIWIPSVRFPEHETTIYNKDRLYRNFIKISE